MAQRLKKKSPKLASGRLAKAAAAPPVAPPAITRGWMVALQTAVILVLGLWIYWPSLHGLYLWDDDFLLQTNETVHDPRGLIYIWTNPQQALIDFFPLTVSVEWLIWQIGAPTSVDPRFLDMTIYFHTASLVLHLGSALMVWHLFHRLGIRLAWLGALIFTVHPVIVESVSWMAELKNTVAMPPFILALLLWIDFDRTRRWDYYILSLLSFLVAVLCKSSVVMFPVIALLYAWWKRGRVDYWKNLRSYTDFESRAFRAFVREFIPNLIPTIPFFLISAFDAYYLIIYLRHGVGEQFIPGLLGGPVGRTACAGLSLIFYFSKCILPVNLMPIYPQWVVNPPSATLEYALKFLPWPVMAFGFGWLLKRRGQPWARAAIFGFGFFFLNVLPFVGWRAISFMRFGWVMDHFLYIPILGLIGLAAAAAGDIYDRLPRSKPAWRAGAIATVVVVLALYTIGSHSYAGIFVNRLTYWTYGAERNFVAWPAHNNRGNQLLDDRRYPEALEEFKIALALNPQYTEAHNNLGYILCQEGRYEEAIAEFRTALSFTPDFESAQRNLQNALVLQAQHPKLNPGVQAQ